MKFMQPFDDKPQAPQLEHPQQQDHSILVVIICLIIGLALSAYIYTQYLHADQLRLKERLLRGTQTLAAYSSSAAPAESFILSNQTLSKIQRLALNGQLITQDLLDAHTFPANEITGESVNLRYHPKVVINESNDTFEMLDALGQLSEFPYTILDSHPAGIRPASNRGEYYPIMLQASTGINNGVNSPGLNHFYDEQFHFIMDHTRDSNILASRTSFPLITSIEPYVIAHYILPLYSPGPMPITITDRRLRHTGFVSAVAFTPAQGFIDFLPDSYLGLEAAFILMTDAHQKESFDTDALAFLGSEKYALEEFNSENYSTKIITRPSFTLQNAMQTPTRWWALSIGLIITTWVCSLLLLFRNRSTKLTQLVNSRTSDLAQRTKKLSELNNALTLSESRYRMLADNVSDVIYTHNKYGTCTYISPSIKQQNGFSPEDYVGKPIYTNLAEDNIRNIKAYIAKNLHLFESNNNSQTPQTFELHTLCKDGSIKPLETTITILFDKQNNAIGYLGVSRDISERKKNETEKLQLEAAFHQSQKMEAIGTLAGGIAHDFNNLLTGILGHAELLKITPAKLEDRENSINTIEKAALRAKDLTSQLLGFARKGHYQSVRVVINDVLNETMDLLKYTINKNISIDCDLPQEQIIVTGDPGQIGQIILNLAVNARDAMPNGGQLTFKLSSVSFDLPKRFRNQGLLKPGQYCELIVSDTGGGIKASDLDRVFEPFFTSKPKGKGTGLGLAMVYGVTQSHGGIVDVKSGLYSGTQFTVYLPLASKAQTNLASIDTKNPVHGKGNILVIDDEDIVLSLAQTMLNKLGYHVVAAVDGEIGAASYEEQYHNIDLVIVDLNMPKVGGLECVQRLIKINPEVKIILSTGYSQDALEEELSKHYICGFLQKPFRLQELSELISKVIKT